MDYISNPVVAIFLCLALGHLIGRLRIGPVELGGVCGTLFVALAIGQLGVTVSDDVKNVAFALFIYALGFTAGPQFFANIRGGVRYSVFPLIEIVTALSLTMLAVVVLNLDPGTAAGLFAGSATESAVVGTASEAIGKLNLAPEEASRMQANIVTAYSLTYLFGLVAIVVFLTQIAPLILRKNLTEEARALADTLGAGDEETTSPSLPVLVERAFEVGDLAGQTVEQFERTRNWTVVIEGVMRGDELVKADLDLMLEPGDILHLRGRRSTIIAAGKLMGKEVILSEGSGLTMVTRDVVLHRKEAFRKPARLLRDLAKPEVQRGIFLTRIRRMGHNIPAFPKTLLQQGDVLTIYGPEETIDLAVEEIGSPLPPQDDTDFVLLGLGIFAGLILGHLSTRIGGVELSLGLGGGALVSGLFFGWLNTRFPAYGALPDPAANFAKDFGLATFIAAIGLGAGPDAIAVIREYGLLFPVLGILLSALPALASLVIGAWVMQVPMPILLGAIAGQHCSTPGLSAVVNLAGNSTPVIGYTVTYAIANVLLPLMGPVVVALTYYVGGAP